MSTDSAAAPVASTFRELKATLYGADAEFLASCQEKELPLAAAQTAWMKELDDRLAKSEQTVETLQKENGELKSKLESAQSAKPKPGFTPHSENVTASEQTGDAVAEWKAGLDAKIAAGMPRAKAVSSLAAEKPELHQAYIAASNAGRSA